MRILIVDDESIFAEGLSRALRRLEPEWVIDCSSSPEHAGTVAVDGSYDVVVLDWNLGHPTITGLTICRDLRDRACGSVVVLLTARDDPNDRIESVSAGADDHIVKHLGLHEIHARITVAAARGPTARRIFQCGTLRIDLDRQQLALSGKPVELAKHQWLLVARLMRWPGLPVSASELCCAAGIEPGEGHKNLRNEVHRLRSRLDQHEPGAGALVAQVRGFGYVLRRAADGQNLECIEGTHGARGALPRMSLK